MRVLFVAPYLPTPGSGGRTRLINVMERVSHGHDVRLVAFTEADQDPSGNRYAGTVLPPRPIRPRPGGVRGLLRFYGEHLSPLPFFVDILRDPAMAAAIAGEVERFDPHIVQIETTEMAQYLRLVPAGPVRALDLQDVASRWFARVARQAGSTQERALLRWELFKTRRYDARHTRIPDVLFLASEIEREFVESLSGAHGVLVPNGVDTTAFVPRDGAVDDDLILFVGPLTYVANLEGVRWFLQQVLPLVERARPTARVELVGAPGDDLPEGLTSYGRVDDVRPYLARAAVSIVPVQFGSGTRYKILEALSMGGAVVSTTVGAEGLDVRHDEHLLLADGPEAFAKAVLACLGSAELRARLGAAGRGLVSERYDWGPLVERMVEAWSVALERRRASTREL